MLPTVREMEVSESHTLPVILQRVHGHGVALLWSQVQGLPLQTIAVSLISRDVVSSFTITNVVFLVQVDTTVRRLWRSLHGTPMDQFLN